MKYYLKIISISTVLLFLSGAYVTGQQYAETNAKPVLWIDPGHVSKRDLRSGPAAGHPAPVGPFRFLKEVTSGDSPKFDMRDGAGRTWRAKLGPEAQSETVATRLVWSVGYFVDDALFFPRLRVRGLPSKLSRGQEFVSRFGVRNVRLEPRPEGRIEGDPWDWDNNPFAGSRELNGLKVLMILLNNYDARKENNRVYFVRAGDRMEAHYYVTDLGATLGKADGFGGHRSKNDLKDFLSTRFVMGVKDDGSVRFDYDTRPTKFGMLSILVPTYYRSQVKKEKAMRSIPVEDAAWIGSLLSQLSETQLNAAFLAARYSRAIRNAYVRSLRDRIRQLTALKYQSGEEAVSN
jgi:hypothetical protein